MIGFVVPVKPKEVSKDWALDNLLLERTARSICAQTNENFRLVIVHNEKPDIGFSHPNIVFVEYPHAAVKVDEIEDLNYVLQYHPREYAEKMMDKGRKIHVGCNAAIDVGCTYLMGIDSDDLISNRLSAFVDDHAAGRPAGWEITKGYIYEENALLLVKKLDMHNINGGTHIIRSDLVGRRDFTSKKFWDYNLFESHGYTRRRISDFHGESLEDYPDFGMVYIIHRNNYSNVAELVQAVTLRNVAKKIVRGTFLSDAIRSEFGLYPIAQ